MLHEKGGKRGYEHMGAMKKPEWVKSIREELLDRRMRPCAQCYNHCLVL
jgi:hypothetical protein